MGVFNRFAHRFFSRLVRSDFANGRPCFTGSLFKPAIRCMPLHPNNLTPSLSCSHSLATYLSLIDPTLQPDPSCRLPISVREVQLAAASTPATTLSVPAGPVTVTSRSILVEASPQSSG